MQTTIPEVFDDVNEALREAVRAIGGNKKVGPMLWPELPLEQAAGRMRDALNPDKRDKLSPEQVVLILRKAGEVGYHGAMGFVTFSAGYEAPRHLTPQDQTSELQMQFVAAVEVLQGIQKQMAMVQGRRR